MTIDSDDTIAAISTSAGEGGIGIVRLSGSGAIPIAERMFRAKREGVSLSSAQTQTVMYGHALDAEGNPIDEVLVTLFRAPHSYTKEDIVEISAHGSMVALRQILHRTLELGARLAEPGEFTKRAFLNGRIDLAQAEAVLDTIRAKTDLALKAAMAQMSGSLSQEIHAVKDELVKIYAHMEAYLDFPEEHLEVYANGDFLKRYDAAIHNIQTLLASFARGEILREGITAVIVGRPNVGKSSLLNALISRERAIVSDIPGTTRDVLEEMVSLDGIPVRLVDTAGLWNADEPLTQAAMQKAREYIERADMFLMVVDGQVGILDDDKAIYSKLNDRPCLLVVNKVDLLTERQATPGIFALNGIIPCFVSAKTRAGLKEIEGKIKSLVWNGEVRAESAQVTRLRHKRALEESLEALQKSRETFLARGSLEFVTLDLKRALDSLKEIVGEVYSDDLLSVIFKEFCIGK